MTVDSNAGALDAALDTALTFVDLAPVNCVRQYADKLCANVFDKAIGARASTLSRHNYFCTVLFMQVNHASIYWYLQGSCPGVKAHGSGRPYDMLNRYDWTIGRQEGKRYCFLYPSISLISIQLLFYSPKSLLRVWN
jgi:hypothetical protein